MALLVSIGCGGGSGRNADVGQDAFPRDFGSVESPGAAEAAGVDSGGRAETAHDGGGPVSVDTGGAAEAGPADGGATGGVDVGQNAAAVDGGAPLNPCDPAAIVALPLTGAGTASEAGAFIGASRLQPRTVGCTTGETGPEVVYALAVPAGVFHLVASTVSATGTTADTILYVQTACGGGQELACNDDSVAPGPSTITTSVTGPQTLYIVVDSFAASPLPPANGFSLTVTLTVPTLVGAACTPVQPDELDPCAAGLVCPPSAGPTATCAGATAPVIDAAELFPQSGQPATETTLFLSAHDAQGDWKNLRLTFKGNAGAVLDSGEYDMTESWGQAAIAEMPFLLSVPAGTVSVDATLTDSTSLTSATVSAVLTPWGELGQSCKAALTAPDPCLNDLVCVNSVCAASSAAAVSCAQATTIALNTPVTGSAAELATDTFEGSCVVDRGGNDKVFRATLPALSGGALAWDLVATTANASVPWDYRSQLDSYLYVRGNCADPATELACNDDLSDTDLRSQVVATNLAPGSYYVFLDTSSPLQNDTTVAYAFQVRARAVLPSGATCAANGIDNRCETGACSALTGFCP